MRRAWLLLLLASCGKAEDPRPDLSWYSDAGMLEEWTSRFPVANREPELKGKVLILDIDRKVVDESLMSLLPRELRPATRAEVGTVVWFKEDKVKVGTYSKSKIDAYQTKSEVNLIDVATKEVFYWNYLTGRCRRRRSRTGRTRSSSSNAAGSRAAASGPG
jgi:hypothetical protein